MTPLRSVLYIGFQRRRRNVVAVIACACNACQNIGIPKLKFVSRTT